MNMHLEMARIKNEGDDIIEPCVCNSVSSIPGSPIYMYSTCMHEPHGNALNVHVHVVRLEVGITLEPCSMCEVCRSSGEHSSTSLSNLLLCGIVQWLGKGMRTNTSTEAKTKEC